MANVVSYKLRASSPQPSGNFASDRNFVLQCFGAEINESIICEDKETFLTTDDMQGIGGDYYSASYRGKDFVTIGNVAVFDAEEVLSPVFAEEDEIPNITVFIP